MDDFDNKDENFFHNGQEHFHGPFQDAFNIFSSFPFGFLNAVFSDGNQESFTSVDDFKSSRAGRSGRSSLRDSMLKQPDSYEEQQLTEQNVTTVPRFFSAFPNQETQDSDLVQKTMSEGEISVTPVKQSFFRSSFSSIIRTADGKIEEQHTICDSNGQEETTVKHILGDQIHTITTKKVAGEIEEVTENIVNMDKDTLPDFNKSWQSVQVHHQTDSGLMNVFKRFFDFITRDI